MTAALLEGDAKYVAGPNIESGTSGSSVGRATDLCTRSGLFTVKKIQKIRVKVAIITDLYVIQ